ADRTPARSACDRRWRQNARARRRADAPAGCWAALPRQVSVAGRGGVPPGEAAALPGAVRRPAVGGAVGLRRASGRSGVAVRACATARDGGAARGGARRRPPALRGRLPAHAVRAAAWWRARRRRPGRRNRALGPLQRPKGPRRWESLLAG